MSLTYLLLNIILRREYDKWKTRSLAVIRIDEHANVLFWTNLIIICLFPCLIKLLLRFLELASLFCECLELIAGTNVSLSLVLIFV